MTFELVQRPAPEPPVGREPFVDLFEGLEPKPVQAPLRLRPDIDQPRVPQYPEMLRHKRLAQAEAVDQVTDGQFALTQEVQDLPARRFGEDGEAHRQSMY